MRLMLDDRPVASSTRLLELGGYHVALSTVLLEPRWAVEVHSSYIGHPAVATRATHLMIAPGHARTSVDEHDHMQLPVTHARERCLLDHLQVLVELATEFGHTLTVELPDHALT
jgi:hypothetical protein